MIWMHIGTNKTGSTALQHHLSKKLPEELGRYGLTYVRPKRKSSSNGLVWALNKRKKDVRREISAQLTAQLEGCNPEHALISSEMFYGMAPEEIFDAVPVLRSEPVVVLVYFRRQDLFLEAMYLQRLKNGRFFGSIQDYIAHFQGSGSDYYEELKPWEDLPNTTLLPRIYERARLHRQSVVSDVCQLLGLPEADLSYAPVSASPSKSRATLLSVLAESSSVNVRQVQRVLMREYPETSAERAIFFTPEERNSFFDSFADGNEALRQAYFSDRDTLFDMSGLGDSAPEPDPAGFSATQIEELRCLFRVLEETNFK